jgi:hypothetical protein
MGVLRRCHVYKVRVGHQRHQRDFYESSSPGFRERDTHSSPHHLLSHDVRDQLLALSLRREQVAVHLQQPLDVVDIVVEVGD